MAELSQSIFWAHLRRHLERHVHDIEDAMRASESAPLAALSSFVHTCKTVDLDHARRALALAQQPPVGALKSGTRSQDDKLRLLLVDDVLNCVALSSCCARVAGSGVFSDVPSAGDDDAAAQHLSADLNSRSLLRETMVSTLSDERTWLLALDLLLCSRGDNACVAGEKFLRAELGDLFSFFFDDNASVVEEEDPEERAFFVSGIVRLLEIVIECMHRCPSDDEEAIQRLFSCNLSTEDDVDRADRVCDSSGIGITLARFLNAALDSQFIDVRALALESVAIAVAKAPGALATAGAAVFARTATTSGGGRADDAGNKLREASAALVWDCIGKGGPGALVSALPEAGDILSATIGGVGWRKSIGIAISSLAWVGAPLEARQEVALALVLAQLRAIEEFGSSGSCRIHERLVLSGSRDLTAREALGAAAVHAAELILDDPRFDLEEVLCDTGP